MEIKRDLVRFNQIYKNLDVIYHNYAKSLGLSDTAFWVFYCISEHNGLFTQRDLCREWYFAPQTLNSALKDMEKHGLISLEPVAGNRKNKLLHLTCEGERIVKEAILPLIQAECESFSALDEKECEQMLSFTERYADALRRSVDSMMK